MDEDTRSWLAGGQSWSSTSPTPAPSSAAPPPQTTKSPRTIYAPAELKTIGRQCSSRLPPVNSIQAMFLYEMQRHTEEEQLFKNQMFRLARSEDAPTAQARRIDELEARMAQMETAMKNKEVEARLATNKSTMQMLVEKSGDCVKKVEGLEGSLREVRAKVVEMIKEGKEKEGAEVAAKEEREARMAVMVEELDALFHDRDETLKMVKKLEVRMAAVEPGAEEGTVLVDHIDLTNGTIQDQPKPGVPSKSADTNASIANSTAKKAAVHTNSKNGIATTNGTASTRPPQTLPPPTTTTQTQNLPLRTLSTSSTTALSIPKGQPQVGLRGSIHAPPPVPTPTSAPRSFSPGKPWNS